MRTNGFVQSARLGRACGWLLAGAMALGGAAMIVAETGPKAPATRTDNVVDDYAGVKVADPYRWLEDQESPETRAWINEQNTYARAQIDAMPGRAAIEKRLTELMKVDAFGIPVERGGKVFYSKRTADQDLSVLYVRNGLNGKDEVLVDPHPMSAGHTTSVNFESISQDGALMAYGIREGGADEVTVRVMDSATRKDTGDGLPKADYLSMAIAPDKQGIYYTLIKKEGPRAYYHAFGGPPSGGAGAADKEIFGSTYGPEMLVICSLSEDGRYLLFHVLHGSAGDFSEVYFQDLKAGAAITPLVKGISAQFSVQIADGKAFMVTNWKAPKGRILEADLSNSAQEHWREIVPEGKAVLESTRLAGGKIVARYTEDASSRLRVYEANGKMLREIALPALGSVSGVSGSWQANDVFYVFQSFVIPQSVYHVDLAKGTAETWAKPSVAIDAASFDVVQVRYKSKDGTSVPMFLVHKKNLQHDGARPVLMTGYGGFNVSETPGFSQYAVLFAEHDGVYALPNLRGGGEFGEDWHKAGMREKKQNVFDDFIGATEYLIAEKYTNPSKMAIRGQSNGGLLVGAALTQRPDLYAAVVCRYPLEDMLRYQNFLVARFWVPEYGSSVDPEQFKYLRAYSPYHNIKAGTKYPAILFVTGDGDTRVAPLHARKMAAAVQAATASDRPVLLLYDTQSGHSGGRPLRKLIEEAADEMVFFFTELGVKA